MAKVLLVDDDLTMVQMVAELLRQEGHEVFPFSNGSAALAGLTDITFNVVGYFWVLVCFRALHYRHFWMDRTLWTAGP